MINVSHLHVLMNYTVVSRDIDTVIATVVDILESPGRMLEIN